jgi:hypothetical protein
VHTAQCFRCGPWSSPGCCRCSHNGRAPGDVGDSATRRSLYSRGVGNVAGGCLRDRSCEAYGFRHSLVTMQSGRIAGRQRVASFAVGSSCAVFGRADVGFVWRWRSALKRYMYAEGWRCQGYGEQALGQPRKPKGKTEHEGLETTYT